MNKSFLIAFDSEVGSEKYNAFTKTFRQSLQSVHDIFLADPVDFVTSKEQIDDMLKKGKYDILICFEKLQYKSIGQGTVRIWMKDYPELKIILVVDNARKSSGKMKGLFDRGYYDASYFGDFNITELVRGVCQSRSREDAWRYYDLDNYFDFADKEKIHSKNVVAKKENIESEQKGSPVELASNMDHLLEEEMLPHLEEKMLGEQICVDMEQAVDGDRERRHFMKRSTEMYENGAEISNLDDSMKLLDEKEEYAYASKNTDDKKRMEELLIDEDDYEMIDAYAEQILSYFTKEDIVKLRNLEMNLLSEQEFSTVIWDKVKEYNLSESEADAVYKISISHFFGYDVIEPLLEDKEVSDIRIMSPDIIRVKRLGLRETVPIRFRSPDHYKSFVSHLASKNNVRIDDTHAIRTFTDTHHDKFFLRINITTEYISGTGLPYVHIRKTSRIKYTITELLHAGMFDSDMMAFLIEKISNDGGIIICGKGGSGKSTLTNTLIEHIPHNNSALIIQENFELFSNSHPEMMEQNLMSDEEINSESNALSYDLKTLAINGLLLDLDYYIIGEIKGGEALYFLNAWYTGHRCMTTLHSDTALHAMDKLVDYAMYESRYSKEELLKMVANRATIIYMKGFKIYEVVETAGWNEKDNSIHYKKIYFRNEGGWIVDTV